MDLQSLLNVYKTRQGVPPILMNQTAPPEPEMKVTASRLPPLEPPVAAPTQPVAGQPNPKAGIVVSQTGFADPLTPQEHKGIFGLKGTWRDIVGGIGDTLVMSKGGDPLYMQRRDKEKIGDITANFANDPELTIQTLHQNGYTEVAAEYEKRLADAQAAQVKADQWQSEQDIRTNEDTRKTNEYNDKGLINVISLLQTGNEKNWPQVSARANQYAESRGISIPFEIPTTYTPGWFDQVNYFGTEPFEVTKQDDLVDYRDDSLGVQNRRLGIQKQQGDQRIGISGRQADTAADGQEERRRSNRAKEKNDKRRQDWAENPANPRNQPRTGRRQRGGPPKVTPAKKK